ncbi:hypothetical protein [Ochrobactrum soli]|uniref:hypothetical protein n=1 Tax=Ochrobactrum soli TaxID=2448455 RepID=UPI000D68590E|nr:hypothetical protein [[Ochrobactrum] soli]
MPILLDLTGQQFGRLIAIARDPTARPTRWSCRCECGNTKVAATNDLRQGKTKSCGCLRVEVTGGKNRTHGLRQHPLYDVWQSIKDRCLNPNNPQFKDYGGRGIKICDEWAHDGAAFIAWAEANGYRAGLIIDRENNNWGYSPENCRFVTRKTSNRNKRNTNYIDTHLGRMMLAEAVEISGLGRDTIRRRLKLGWPASKILQPARAMKKSSK